MDNELPSVADTIIPSPEAIQKETIPERILLEGNALQLSDVRLVIESERVEVGVASSSRAATEEARRFLDQAAKEKIIYGVNTGFGPMASHIISKEELAHLQENLIRSHAVGMGNPVEERFVLAAMVVRLNTLAKGCSGVSEGLLDQLCLFINKRILPVIPEHGAVGTSGDLVQLAHIGLALLGEGDVFYKGRREPARDALERFGITPYVLRPKEGLSLINGTSFMTGVGAVLCLEAERMIDISLRLGAAALETMHAFDDYISKTLHDLRPHDGQRWAAKRLRMLLESSHLMRRRDALPMVKENGTSTYTIDEEVQSVYSLRCIPQIVGPVKDALEHMKRTIEIEMNSVTDNPIIDARREQILHGGNFHGEAVAATLDALKARLIKLTMLAERRINFFLHPGINKKFSPFLNLKKPGLTLGLQGLQFVATSTAAQSQSLAFPHSIHSISTNADNQDIVSMGADAALLTAKVVENAYVVLAIEAIVLMQAIEAAGEQDRLSSSSREIVGKVRKILPPVYDDRNVSAELAEVVRLLKREECFNT